MVQFTEKGDRADGSLVRRFLVAAARRIAIETLMRSVDIVVFKIIGQDAAEMIFTKNNHVIETLSANRADDALRIRVFPRRTHGGFHFLNIDALNTPLKLFALLSRHCHAKDIAVPRHTERR